LFGLLSFPLGCGVAYQGADQLRQYGANIFVADLVGLSMLREFAPLITAIIVAGRSGSVYAAQIGTMAVTEEIDAMRTIGIAPLELLVVPKFIALLIAPPPPNVFPDCPGVFCGLIIDPTDAFLFGQINDGNAISMPYAKGFGWAAELNLQDVYRKIFDGERGLGYPKERAEIMRKNRGILKDLKAATCKDMLTVLQSVDQDLLKAAIAGKHFKDYFYANAQDEGIVSYLRGLTG